MAIFNANDTLDKIRRRLMAGIPEREEVENVVTVTQGEVLCDEIHNSTDNTTTYNLTAVRRSTVYPGETVTDYVVAYTSGPDFDEALRVLDGMIEDGS